MELQGVSRELLYHNLAPSKNMQLNMQEHTSKFLPPFLVHLFEINGAVAVTLTSAWTSHLKFYLHFFHMMGKARTGELSSTRTGLV